jgi:hypothetical protein
MGGTGGRILRDVATGVATVLDGLDDTRSG